MLLIVAHHYVVNSGLLEVLSTDNFTATNAAMLLFGAWGKTGINCFVMITGWFLCKSNITAQKLIKLYAQIAIYTIIIYAIFCISGHESFHPVQAVLKLFPVKDLNSGFTSCFLVFYILIPFINKLLPVLTKRLHALLLIILLFFYSVLPIFPAYALSFNYVSWFIIIYLTASYIRFYGLPVKISHKSWGLISLLLIVVASISVLMLARMYSTGRMGAFNPYFFIADSNKLLSLAIAVSSFMYFKDVRIPHSKLINAVGASTFGVLLIHANSDAMRQWLWKETVDCTGNYTDSLLFTVGYAAACVLIVFVVCSGIEWFRSRLIDGRLARWSDSFFAGNRFVKKIKEGA